MAEFILDSEAPAAGQPGAAGDLIKDSDTNNFMVDVIEASRQVPVIVDFWAPWCGPCKQLGPALEKAVRAAGGMVKLVKIDIDQNQELAAQMRIQSIPAVYAFKDGSPVDGFVGAVPESQIRTLIDRLTGGAKQPIDDALEQAKAALEAGDAATAGDIYAQVLQHDPTNGPALGGLIRCATATGDFDGARQIASGLTTDLQNHAEVRAAVSALELAEQGGRSDADLAGLRAAVEADPKNHQARFDLAMALYGAGQSEAALDELLEIVSRDRKWKDEAAREQMVKIFEALGPTHPVTVAARRKLSSVLFS